MKIKLIILIIIILTFYNGNLFANNFCDRLSEIKEIPFKNEKVEDVVYNGLLEKGKDVIPCLINKLTDTTIMKDPRKAPPYSNITIGDIAFFILLDITNLPFEKFLPENVQIEYKMSGVYAYFKYVNCYENRKLLQNNWLTWLQSQNDR